MWTQPVWLVGLVLLFVVVLATHPERFAQFTSFGGTAGASAGLSLTGVGSRCR